MAVVKLVMVINIFTQLINAQFSNLSIKFDLLR